MLYFFQGNYKEALEQFEEPGKNLNIELVRVAQIMKGLCLMQMGKLFDAAMWFNGYSQTTVPESQPKYDLFRDLSLSLADKSFKDIFSTWKAYSKEKYEVDYITKNGGTVFKDKGLNPDWPVWKQEKEL